MTPSPSGRLEGRTVTFTREFRAPAVDVWDAVTDPVRMERWLGTWSGDPASGQVEFCMTAEGEDAPTERVQILECTPPERLEVRWLEGDWHIAINIHEVGGITRLDFAQTFATGEPVTVVGPGWEYYLDRLGAHLAGHDVSAIEWSDYEPLMAHYGAFVRRIDEAD